MAATRSRRSGDGGGAVARTGDEAANEKLKHELHSRLRRDIGDEYVDRCPLYVLDSETESGIGERVALESWLKKSIYRLVAAQGTVVPTYWEIAQNMVEKWLPKSQARDLNADASKLQQSVHPRLTVPVSSLPSDAP